MMFLFTVYWQRYKEECQNQAYDLESLHISSPVMIQRELAHKPPFFYVQIIIAIILYKFTQKNFSIVFQRPWARSLTRVKIVNIRTRIQFLHPNQSPKFTMIIQLTLILKVLLVKILIFRFTRLKKIIVDLLNAKQYAIFIVESFQKFKEQLYREFQATGRK